MKISKKQGFSLVEVLFSLMVLSVGVASIAVLMTSNIKNSINAKNKIVASELAQEGIELMRNLKDNKSPIMEDLVAGTYSNRRIDKDSSVADDINGNDKQLYLNNSFYTHNASGIPTKFHRSISFSVAGNASATPSTRVTTVTSFVSWNSAGSFSPCDDSNECVSVVSVLPDLD